jgi:hypothetical protein
MCEGSRGVWVSSGTNWSYGYSRQMHGCADVHDFCDLGLSSAVDRDVRMLGNDNKAFARPVRVSGATTAPQWCCGRCVQFHEDSEIR